MRRALAAAATVVAAVIPARASTVLELAPDALYAGADRVVEATVIARTTAWNATRTGLETRAVLAVGATLKGASASVVEVVVPGGELDGARHVIVGMPSIDLGEQARWFLRDRGDGQHRVYGWAQGKWPARTLGATTTFAPAPVSAERDGRFVAFATNGMVWPAAKIPVPYLIQTTGSADLVLADEISAIDAAFATWQAVPCSSLAFTNAGMTDLGMAVDGTNVMLFLESGWVFGSEAAAATSLWIIDGEQTADIAVNGQDFRWAIGPAGSAARTGLLDLQAVMTHEIGHFSGLGHTMRAFDTMYYSWKPWPGQRSISIDDKLGLCALYPTTGDECPSPACPTDEACVDHGVAKLCTGTPDPIGAPCNYDRVECDAFCLFTAANLSTGYCSRFCESNADCPLTHHCDEASAGGTAVKVCFDVAQPPPDAGAGACAADTECPTGLHCDVPNSACTFECRTDDDCAGARCDDRGRCAADADGGCGCRTGAGGYTVALGALAIGLVLRRRARAGRRADGRRRARSARGHS